MTHNDNSDINSITLFVTIDLSFLIASEDANNGSSTARVI